MGFQNMINSHDVQLVNCTQLPFIRPHRDRITDTYSVPDIVTTGSFQQMRLTGCRKPSLTPSWLLNIAHDSTYTAAARRSATKRVIHAPPTPTGQIGSDARLHSR